MIKYFKTLVSSFTLFLFSLTKFNNKTEYKEEDKLENE